MPGGRVEVEVVPDLKDFPGKLSSGLKSASGIASSIGKGLGLAVAAGTAVAAVGLKSVIDLGTEYVGNLNELQAVTGATGLTMSRVGDLAKELGADMSLPATSAADAAAAMKELAKGGLSVDQAMTAAKGTLQLAAAAQIEAAQAAEIQSDALNQFGLSADQAGHVADVLANTANAASGEITDMANALKYIGPVARGLNIDIDNTAAAVGLLAVNGIRGEQAGTSLRGILASLASPSKEAKKAMDALGISAFDAQGKFVGLRTFTDQLAQAKKRLSDADFAAASSTAFGNEGFTAANSLALSGAEAFDSMAESVSKAGGAAAVAASKTQGLGGAWEGLKSQLETSAIGIFEAIDGPLEKLVRSAADIVAKLGDGVVRGLETAIAAGEVYGPRLAEAIRSRGAVVAAAGRSVILPLVQGAVNPLNEGLNTGIELWNDFTDVLKNAVEGARPAAEGIGDIAKAAADGDGPLSALGAGVGLLGDAVRIASGVLVPLGRLVGGIADAFADLPGPIQTAVVALGLVAAFRGRLSDLGTTVRDKVTEPFTRFNETLRLQQALLTGSSGIASAQVGQLGLAMSALEKHVPVIGRMADSFRNASTAAQGFVVNQSALVQTASGISGQYTGLASVLSKTEGALRGLAGAAAGTAAAVGTGLKAAATGLVGALGGPFGLAIGVASVGLSLLADSQASAAEKARKHAAAVDSLAAALRESNGQVNEQVKLAVAQRFLGDEFKVAADAAKRLGVSMTDVTSAALDQGGSLDGLRSRLQGVIAAHTTQADVEANAAAGIQDTSSYMDAEGVAAQNLLNAINSLAGDTAAAEAKNKALAEALQTGTASMIDGTDAGRSLGAAMGVLASNTASADDRARALKDALDALSGGTIDLEAAQSRVFGTLDRLKDKFGETLDKTKGWGTELNNAGAALIKADGSINLATQNGRDLRDALQDLTEQTAETASRTYDLAIAQGDTVPEAMVKARDAMQQSRDAFIASREAMGLTADEAGVLADKAGLIPDNVTLVVTSPGSDAAKNELILIKGLVDRVPPGKDITMRTISAEAEAKLVELGFTVQHMPDGTVKIQANTDPARQQLDSYLREPTTKYVDIRYRDPGAPAGARVGQPNLVNHDGNIVVKAFASGGLHRKLTPMPTGIAAVVRPNTWRVLGDRMRDNEAYIPINKSFRSQQILMQTAREMGFDVIKRFALGGVAFRTAEALNANASATQALQLSLGQGSGAASFPSTVTLVDANGSILGQMRVIAQQALNETSREVQLRRGRVQ